MTIANYCRLHCHVDTGNKTTTTSTADNNAEVLCRIAVADDRRNRMHHRCQCHHCHGNNHNYRHHSRHSNQCQDRNTAMRKRRRNYMTLHNLLC